MHARIIVEKNKDGLLRLDQLFFRNSTDVNNQTDINLQGSYQIFDFNSFISSVGFL